MSRFHQAKFRPRRRWRPAAGPGDTAHIIGARSFKGVANKPQRAALSAEAGDASGGVGCSQGRVSAGKPHQEFCEATETHSARRHCQPSRAPSRRRTCSQKRSAVGSWTSSDYLSPLMSAGRRRQQSRAPSRRRTCSLMHSARYSMCTSATRSNALTSARRRRWQSRAPSRWRTCSHTALRRSQAR